MAETLQILIAEDNPADIFLIKAALTEHGLNYSAHSFKDGAEAALFLSRVGSTDGDCHLDIALLDLNLPKVEGHELLRIIRQHPACSSIPVVIVTSSDSANDRERALEEGVSFYFRKSSNLEEFFKLGDVIKQLVEGRARATAGFHATTGFE